MSLSRKKLKLKIVPTTTTTTTTTTTPTTTSTVPWSGLRRRQKEIWQVFPALPFLFLPPPPPRRRHRREEMNYEIKKWKEEEEGAQSLQTKRTNEMTTVEPFPPLDGWGREKRSEKCTGPTQSQLLLLFSPLSKQSYGRRKKTRGRGGGELFLSECKTTGGVTLTRQLSLEQIKKVS